ncbi:helix-turn-helix domain-containing protein [Mycobacterium riyadhense]|uniref:helix-turn-helix domain-containing protein n=1 Tax=Mycobacterium riyadhense TaxID=486698 RepID=UPI00195E0DDB|nr:helix-turn-helix transcriptional regulator [Mycobacterium riyadhense]
MTASSDEEFDQQTLAARLREVREYLGLSQQYVASATGIARPAMSEIERGNRKVDSLELRKLARLYRYPVSYFLGVEDPSSGISSALGRVLVDLTSGDHDEVLRFAEFLQFQRDQRARES